MSLGRSKRKQAPSTSFRPNKVRNVSKESPSASTRDDDAQDIEDDGEDLMAGAMNFVDDFGMGDEDAEDFEEDYESEGDMEEDSERSEGDGEDDIVQAEGGPKKASKKTAGDKKAAADEKLDKMRETYSLGHVNTTKLKIDALLSSVTPSRSSPSSQKLSAFLFALKDHLSTLPALEASSISEAERTLKRQGSSMPFPEPRPDTTSTKWKLGFERPKEVHVVGSWASGNEVKRPGEWDVDLMVVMPESLFQENDNRDFRYFHKRAYYLAVVAASVKTSKLGADCTFLFGKDARKPLLELRPKKHDLSSDYDFSKLRCVVRIHATWDVLPTPLSRLSPSKCNIRRIADDEVRQGAQKTIDQDLTPTPRYNSSFMSDNSRTVLAHLLFLHRISKACPGFADSARLLKVWLWQRGYGRPHLSPRQKERSKKGKEKADAGGGPAVVGAENFRWIMTMLLAHLIEGSDAVGKAPATRKVSGGLDAMGLFKAILAFLSQHDFANTPLAMRPSGEKPGFAVEEFIANFESVFVDSSGTMNLLSGVPLSSLQMLSYDARLTLAQLNLDAEKGFSAALMHPLDDLQLRFDNVVRVRLSRALISSVAAQANTEGGTPVEATLSLMDRTLRRALTNRAIAFSLLVLPQPSGPVDKMSLDAVNISLGIILDPVEAGRLIDRGPSIEDAEAVAAFRDFWGPKSELRRFKDGSIIECVVWEADTPLARSRIVGQLVSYILAQKLAIQPGDLEIFGASYTDLVVEPKSARDALYTQDPEQQGFGSIFPAYEEFGRILRNLEDIPLGILNITPVAEALRYSSVFVPGPRRTKPSCLRSVSSPKFVSIHDVLLQFETSGKWPEDLEAMQKIKAALLGKMAEQLLVQVPGCRASVAFDADARPSEDNCSLEIFMPEPNGFAFRARIHHAGENTLYERIIQDRPGPLAMYTDADKTTASSSLTRYHRRFVAPPKLHSALSSLHHRSPAFSTTVRLVKRWFASHLLLETHVDPVLVELICASVFLNADGESPYGIPASGSTGFARVLHMLSTWKWRTQPLLVPIFTFVNSLATAPDLTPQERAVPHSRSFPQSQRDLAIKAFEDARKSDPGLNRDAIFVVCTEDDLMGNMWSGEGPNKVVATRITQLAKASVECIHRAIGQEDVFHVRQIFRSPLHSYDFILHLDPRLVSRSYQGLDPPPLTVESSYKPQANVQEIFALTDEILTFVRDLQRLYADSVLFFYDVFGGTILGGVLNPSLATTERNFRVGLDYSSAPTASTGVGKGAKSKKNAVVFNGKGVVADICRFSKGLVVGVEWKNA